MARNAAARTPAASSRRVCSPELRRFATNRLLDSPRIPHGPLVPGAFSQISGLSCWWAILGLNQ
jgi:hypothetical protein